MPYTKLLKKVFTITPSNTNFLSGSVTTPAFNGYVKRVKVTTPGTVDNSATVATTIADADGVNLPLASGFATQAVNTTVEQHQDTATQPNNLQMPVAEPLTITSTFSANQTVGRTVTITLYVEQLF